MSDVKEVKEFPDLSNKLAAPKKQSIFERQKAEAEAKRIREEAETAAVYEDFVKSFDDEDIHEPGNQGVPRGRAGLGSGMGAPMASAPGKRHFTATGPRKSGPGSLGPPSLPAKRAYDGSRVERVGERERGMFAYDDAPSSKPLDTATAFRTSDDEDEKSQDTKENVRAAAKPTLKLSSLPPGTSIPVIKKLMPENLVVDSVRLLPLTGPDASNSVERKSMSAIVAFAQDTPASDLDSAVSTLQNTYLGWGFSLSISRHLSSATLGPVTTASVHSALTSLPFGAQPIPPPPGQSLSLSRAPPPGPHRGGYAPPSSYRPPGFARGPPPLQVKVAPPTDIRQLKIIHKTVEAVISNGPEFEALLMSRAEVQKDEKWAWLWNPRSQGGVWYRWRLWQILTGTKQQREPFRHQVFEGGVPWLEPEDNLPFEFITQYEDFISASDYHSSDEDDSDEESEARRRRRHFASAGGPPDTSVLATGDEQSYLSPLQKARLTFLLARLPTTTAKLRRGDVARVTAFAVSHAGQGAEEVVDILVSNVLRPYCFSHHANPNSEYSDGDIDMTGVDSEHRNGEDGTNSERPAPDTSAQTDTSSATLIALHLISDILSASSTSGVRHAWRYRAYFETSLLTRNIFAYLGRLEKTHGWGRLRTEKWRRSVNNVLQLWETWCVFPAGAQERFVRGFNEPPSTEEEVKEEERKKERERVAAGKGEARSKWKSVDVNAGVEEGGAEAMDVDKPRKAEVEVKNSTKAVNGSAAVEKTGDQHKLPRSNDDSRRNLSSQTARPDAVRDTSQPQPSPAVAQAAKAPVTISQDSQPPSRKRQRPRAEDMFADSDED